MVSSIPLMVTQQEVITKLIQLVKTTLPEEVILDHLITNGMLIRDIYVLGLLPNTNHNLKGGK